jgi:hypothetical protein
MIQNRLSKKWGPKAQNIKISAVLGKWDPLCKDSVIQQWKKGLPQIKSNIKILENVGHFVEEVKPKLIAEEIKKQSELI